MLANWGTGWGLIISFATFVLVGWGAVAAIRRWRKLKYPFAIRKCGVSKYSFPSLADFKKRSTVSFFHDKSVNWSKKLTINGKGEHIICIELRPNVSLEIDYINIRFLPEDSEDRPKVIDFNETYRSTFHETFDDQGLGRIGKYKQPVNVHKGADLYFIAKCQTYNSWDGQLSIRFYISGQDAQSRKIPAKVVV